MSIDELLAQDRAQNHEALLRCEKYVRWLRTALGAQEWTNVLVNAFNLEETCIDIRAFARRHSGSGAWRIAETALNLHEAAVTIRRLATQHQRRQDTVAVEVALEEARQAAILVADLRERMFGAVDASEVGSAEGP